MKNKISLIEIVDKSIDWKNAIKLGVDLLVKNNIATSELSNAIIDSTLKMGPYYILMPKVALAHTAPGEYNKKVGLSLILFKKPIKFSDNERHQVNLLFTLSAIDSDSHMNILVKFSELFSSDSILEQSLRCKSKEELVNIFGELL